MTTVDAAIIKHITNGVLNGSNNTSSNHLELRKVAEFTNVDTSDGFYVNFNLPFDQFYIGDIIRFHKQDTQETIDFVIKKFNFEMGLTACTYYLYKEGETSMIPLFSGLDKQGSFIIHDINKYNVNISNSSPPEVYRLVSDDPLTALMLQQSQFLSSCIRGLCYEVEELK